MSKGRHPAISGSRANGAGAGRLFPLLCLLFSVPCAHAAEGARPLYASPSPAVGSGSIAQIVFSLLLVLAAIVLVAWLLRRMNAVHQGPGNQIRVLGGVSVGQRERIVLVEIKDTWLVVGVGPGQVRALHALRKTEDGEPEAGDALPPSLSSENRFAGLLSSVLKHHKQKTADK